jgi:hypothetical protein
MNDLRHFCTIAGKDYVLKAAALHHSLQRHAGRFKLWICTIDPLADALLRQLHLANTELIPAEDLADERIRKIKGERKTNEYCWTLKAPFMEHLLARDEIRSLVYLDGDLFFFSDPQPLFDEWGAHSVFLCPQRDYDWVERTYGKYQAGLIGFKKEDAALQGLKWWKERCLEWCSAEPDADKFGDQKYLERLSEQVPGLSVKVSEHLGINAAPWNCIYHNDFTVSVKDGGVCIEDDRLVAFHFACVSVFSDQEFDLWSMDPMPIDSVILQEIYVPYLAQIRAVMQEVRARDARAVDACLSPNRSKAKTYFEWAEPRPKDSRLHFATIISREYVIKGLALYDSLNDRTPDFHLWICCMDDISYEALRRMELTRATLIRLQDIEDEPLRQVKGARKLYEYCWTLKAPLCLHVLKRDDQIDHIVYCDADMYFFSDPRPIRDEWGNHSVFLCPQRGSDELEKLHGKYQAGLIGFKRDENGLRALQWWRDKCIEKCADQYDEAWGDQKYLDAVPDRFPNVKLIDHIGIDAAPWNLVMHHDYAVRQQDQQVFLDDRELIAFHFGSMVILSPYEFDLWKLEPLNFKEPVIRHIYAPYIRQIKKSCEKLKGILNADLSLFFATPSGSYRPFNFVQM